MYMLHVRLWLFSFIEHAKDKEVYRAYHAVRLG